MKLFSTARKLISLTAIFLVGFLLASHSVLLAESDLPDWSYGGADNPTQWGSLSDEFVKCEIGRDQSPIDLDDAINGTGAAIEFNYDPVSLNLVNNGHTIQANYEPGSSITLDGEEYELLQFHFHTPSEHTISGKASAMEVHLVHRNQAGELAVIGILMAEGKANPLIEQIWEYIPKKAGDDKVKKLAINAADLLPRSQAYFSYAGSLTTPPCSENVKWNVLTEPIRVSEEQIARFQSLYQVNARPIQSTNGRIVELHN